MSRIYKCDRCGTIMERLPFYNHYRIGWQNDRGILFKDLCEKCCEELKQWYNIFKDEEDVQSKA